MDGSTAKEVESQVQQQTVVVEKKKSSFLSGFSGTFGVVAAIIVILLLLCCCSVSLLVIPVALTAINSTKNISEINPAMNTSDARNTQRKSDVEQIFNAVSMALGDSARLPISGKPTCMEKPQGTNIGNLKGLVNLEPVLVPSYLDFIPVDPQGGTKADTGYSICMDYGDHSVLKVFAPKAENGEVINMQSKPGTGD